MQIEDRPSPNHDTRSAPVTLLVLHYTGMADGPSALARLTDPEAKVSAHYLVMEDGSVLRLVPEGRRAWHAGVSYWQGFRDINARSVGIEIVNGGHDFRDAAGGLPAYGAAQIDAVITLARAIIDRHAIRPTGIVGHSDIAPTRKTDPGEHFPWPGLAAAGIGLWPPPPARPAPAASGETAAPGPLLGAIGYETEDLPAALRAFQRRWLPDHISGLADRQTLSRLVQIAQAYSLSGASSPQA